MATVTKGRTFVSGETVTPAKLNELVDNATVTAIQTADISDSQITTAKIADANVTTAKIANASITPSKLSQPYTLETAKASTSGTSVEFTGIPSWAKRITVILSGVSLSGTANILIQIGSGSFTTSGYASWSNFLLGGSSSGLSSSSSGFVVHLSSAATSIIGTVSINLLTGNSWVATGVGAYTANGGQMFTAGNVPLSGALDRLRVTNTATDTFDAGTINISYEG